jgi:Spy/CpxP family protein refolding chaperone
MLPGRVVAYVQYRDREQAMALVGATKPDLKTAAAKVSECEAQKTQLEVQGNDRGHQESIVLMPRAEEELPGGSLADAMLQEMPCRRA